MDDKVEDEALTFDEDDIDFEADKGMDRATDANLFETLDLTRVGTNEK
jgi:hypothetical protein